MPLKHNNISQYIAEKMAVGIASIKRWEGGLIQTRSMDKALRAALSDSRLHRAA
ncbi:MAG: hypothetical protein GY795_40035 [Desulfobacterales bacterium]|nr:hypothetical protein [Desulfobacterales bacterium]